MAVIVKYIVVRNGEEKMTFATKKEADAHDKMLDIADNLFEFLDNSDLKLSETQMEAVSLLLAQSRDLVMPILRGITPKKKGASAPKSTPKPAPKPAPEKTGSEKPVADTTEPKPADKPVPKPKRSKK
ncbi:MAG: YebG family protein [Desulfobacteraceae bacterium]|nr:YebG family protein [Desulfobacteraceae bacterium]